MEDKNEKKTKSLPESYFKVDRRYRDSKYFLVDQLRYASEPVQEYRSIKQSILQSGEFNLAQRNFQFAEVFLDF